MRKAVSNTVIILLVTVALCVLIEAPFRIYDHWVRFPEVEAATTGNLGDANFGNIISYLFKTGRAVRDPDLIWRHTPESKTYEFNSLGLRGKKEFSKRPGFGVFRIIVFGGSQPFGLGVDADEAYSAYLEDKLSRNCKSQKFEVINAASPGHSTVQVLNLFRLYMIDYAPALIIVDAGLNDQIPLSGDYPLQDKDLVAMDPLTIRLVSIAERSSFFWYLRGWLTGLGRAVRPPVADGPQKRLTRVSLEDTFRNYEEIKKVAAASGIETLFVSQFALDRDEVVLELFPMSHRTEPFVDVYTRLSQSPDLLADFSDDVHTTAQGHEKIASYIYEYLFDRVCPEG